LCWFFCCGQFVCSSRGGWGGGSEWGESDFVDDGGIGIISDLTENGAKNLGNLQIKIDIFQKVLVDKAEDLFSELVKVDTVRIDLLNALENLISFSFFYGLQKIFDSRFGGDTEKF
jgi:hypothetical protein